MFSILMRTDGAEWEWIVDTEQADAVWRLLGPANRTDIHVVPVRHGQLETGL